MTSRALPAASEEVKQVRAASKRNDQSCFDVPPLVLPFSGCPAPNVPLHLASVAVPLSVETEQRIRTLASDPSLVFLAAWYVLLWRFTDQSEVLVGCVESQPHLTIRTRPL